MTIDLISITVELFIKRVEFTRNSCSHLEPLSDQSFDVVDVGLIIYQQGYIHVARAKCIT